MARQGRRGHDGILRIFFRHNLELGEQYRIACVSKVYLIPLTFGLPASSAVGILQMLGILCHDNVGKNAHNAPNLSPFHLYPEPPKNLWTPLVMWHKVSNICIFLLHRQPCMMQGPSWASQFSHIRGPNTAWFDTDQRLISVTAQKFYNTLIKPVGSTEALRQSLKSERGWKGTFLSCVTDGRDTQADSRTWPVLPTKELKLDSCTKYPIQAPMPASNTHVSSHLFYKNAKALIPPPQIHRFEGFPKTCGNPSITNGPRLIYNIYFNYL